MVFLLFLGSVVVLRKILREQDNSVSAQPNAKTPLPNSQATLAPDLIHLSNTLSSWGESTHPESNSPGANSETSLKPAIGKPLVSDTSVLGKTAASKP